MIASYTMGSSIGEADVGELDVGAVDVGLDVGNDVVCFDGDEDGDVVGFFA